MFRDLKKELEANVDGLLELMGADEEQADYYMKLYDENNLKLDMMACDSCYSLCKSRRQVVPFKSSSHFPIRKPIMFLAEAPGGDEDLQGEPLVGRCGKLFNAALDKIGIKREEVALVSIVSCRPYENREPFDEEIIKCRYWLDKQIEMIDPWLIVGLGRVAAKSMRPGCMLRHHHGKYFLIGDRCPGKGRIGMVTYHPGSLFKDRDIADPDEGKKAGDNLRRFEGDFRHLGLIAKAYDILGAFWVLDVMETMKNGKIEKLTGEELEEVERWVSERWVK